MAIYKRALSATEIHDIYVAAEGGKCTPPPLEQLIIAGPITNSANGHWYYLTTEMLWQDAENVGERLGGHLTTINDDDTPPVVTIVSPARSEITIPTTVGLMVNAEATRDTPQGITNIPVTWSKVSGPGTVTFETVTSTASAASFSTPGTYVLRASSTYGATTVSDEVRVNMGLALTASVPWGARAAVTVPVSDPAAAVISEGGAPVWVRGAFVSGAQGITGALAGAGGVTFDCGGGAYAFTVGV